MKKQIFNLLKNLFLLMVIIYISLFLQDVTSASKSADNSLSSIIIENVKLSPSFRYNRLKYNANVDNSIKSLKITAIPSNKFAKVVEITGADDLKVGMNVITIKVKAYNGKIALYTIYVKRAIENEGDNNNDVDSKEIVDDSTVKSKIEKFSNKEKLSKKNKKIRELKNKIDGLTDENTSLKDKYQSIANENRKMHSQKIIFIIIIMIISGIAIISLFIGIIRSNTKKYIHDEFENNDEVASKNIVNITSNTDQYQIQAADDNYAIMKHKSNIIEDDTVIFKDIENISMELNQELPKNNVNLSEENQSKEEDDFSIDIIEL